MKKILILDDLMPFIEKEKSVLSRSEFQIFTAAKAEEAISLHRKEKVDMIIADLDMPGMCGEEMCRIIRADEEMRKVSIIMVCPGRKADKERCSSSGANEYITKPVDAKMLVEKVSMLLNIPERKNLRVLTKISVKGNFKSDSFFGTTEDISVSGLLLETDRVLAKGDKVVCSFFMPDSDRIEINGEIMRVVKKGSAFHYGVRFTDVNWDIKNSIEGFVNRHYR